MNHVKFERTKQVRVVIRFRLLLYAGLLFQEANEMKRNLAFIQCSLQAEFEEKLRQKATELSVPLSFVIHKMANVFGII